MPVSQKKYHLDIRTFDTLSPFDLYKTVSFFYLTICLTGWSRDIFLQKMLLGFQTTILDAGFKKGRFDQVTLEGRIHFDEVSLVIVARLLVLIQYYQLRRETARTRHGLPNFLRLHAIKDTLQDRQRQKQANLKGQNRNNGILNEEVPSILPL